MFVDEMTGYKMTVDKMNILKMTAVEITVDKMNV
jgi:hypothetical protein